ncbi:hypothetical protein EON67_05390, partial [archaeon]
MDATVIDTALAAVAHARGWDTPPTLLSRRPLCALDQSDTGCVEARGPDGRQFKLFEKWMDVPALRKRVAKSEERWRRVTVPSFRNELRLYTSRAAALLRTYGVLIPTVFASSATESAVDDLDSVFHLVLEFLDDTAWEQPRVFDGAYAERALTALAAWHAAFWHADDDCAKAAADSTYGKTTEQRAPIPAHIFPLGGWWRKPLRWGEDFTRATAAFSHLLAHFPFLRDLDTAENHAAVAWMAHNTDVITADVSYTRRTLMHGDFKTSNLYFASAARTRADADADTMHACDMGPWRARLPHVTACLHVRACTKNCAHVQ